MTEVNIFLKCFRPFTFEMITITNPIQIVPCNLQINSITILV